MKPGWVLLNIKSMLLFLEKHNYELELNST